MNDNHTNHSGLSGPDRQPVDAKADDSAHSSGANGNDQAVDDGRSADGIGADGQPADSKPGAGGLTPRRKLLFGVLTVLLVWLVLDTGLYVFLSHLDKTRDLFYGFELPDSEQIAGHAERFFHPRWGWDIPAESKGQFGNRKGRDYAPKQRYEIKAFGDSFTYCSEVADNETWEHYVEEQTGWDCLNFGVSGYGPDQALLKYRDIEIPTRFTVLGIWDENIGRLMAQWWGFYRPGGIGMKPRFEVAQDGSIRLVESPIKGVDDLERLRDRDFMERLKESDYWFAYDRRLGRPTKLRWPATFTVVSHWGFFSKYLGIYVKNIVAPSFDSERATRKFSHLYEVDSPGLAIMKHVIEQFTATAKERQETPVVMILPTWHSVDMIEQFGRSPYGSLVDYLQETGCVFVDIGEVFAQEQYDTYYVSYNGHFSPRGNKRVADVLVDCIRDERSSPATGAHADGPE